MSDNGLLNEFYEHNSLIKRYADSTSKQYLYSIKPFFSYLDTHNYEIEKITNKNLIDYLSYEHRKLSSDESFRNIYKALLSLGDFLVFKNIWSYNLVDMLKRPKMPPKPLMPDFLSIEEIETFLDSIDKTTILGLRDYTIFELLYSCGLRISELVSLKKYNVNVIDSFIIVMGKGQKERIVPFGSRAKDIIEIYITRVRPILTISHDPKEFIVSMHGDSITRQTVWKRLQYYKSISHVETKLHTFRHSFATHLFQGGADISSISMLLGHNSLNTTMIYTHIDNKDIEKKHNQAFNSNV